MTATRAALRAGLVALAVVVADQTSKGLVRASVEPFERRELVFGIDLVNVRNSGVAFGFLSGGGALVLVVTLVALAGLLAFFATHARRPLAWLPTGLLLGGAAGNLIDRAREGAVTDFIDPPLWPAFNVADTCITLGVITLLYVLEGPPRRREAAARAQERERARERPPPGPAGETPVASGGRAEGVAGDAP